MQLPPTESHTHTHTQTHTHTHTRTRMRVHTVLNTDDIFGGLKSKFGAAVWPTHSHTTHSLFNVLQCVAVCCNVLQCVAVCCSVLQCVAVAVCCSVAQKHTLFLSHTHPHSHARSLPFTHTPAHMQAPFLEDSNPCEVLLRDTLKYIYIYIEKGCLCVSLFLPPSLTHPLSLSHT